MKATKEVDKGMPTVLPPMLEAFIRGLVNAGGINRAVVDVLAQVGQRAVLCVGGDVHIVHLHDVGHTAGGSVGGQLLKVAVPARGNSLEGDVGMLAGVEIEHLLRQVVAGLTAPPGDADGNRLVGAFGSGLGGGGSGSALGCGAVSSAGSGTAAGCEKDRPSGRPSPRS